MDKLKNHPSDNRNDVYDLYEHYVTNIKTK